MDIELFRFIESQTKLGFLRTSQMLRIGTVLEASKNDSTILLEVDFGQDLKLKGVPLLSFNGLQRFPNLKEQVLVFSPEGRMEHAIALAVVETKSSIQMGETSLISGENQVLMKDSSISIKHQKNLGELLIQLVDLIEGLAAIDYFIPVGPGVAPNPAKQSSILAEAISLKKELQEFI